jgi:cellulose biosynthesis protein BcsQ
MADALAHDDLNILVVDLDPLANSTYLLASATPSNNFSVNNVLDGTASASEAIVRSALRGVDLLGATRQLATMEGILKTADRATIMGLGDALELVAPKYDFILFDTPPSFGYLTSAALAASDIAFIPIYAPAPLWQDVSATYKHIQHIKSYNPALNYGGVIPNHLMGDAATPKQHSSIGDRSEFMLFDQGISYSPEHELARANGQTILRWNYAHPSAKEAIALARCIAKVASDGAESILTTN